MRNGRPEPHLSELSVPSGGARCARLRAGSGKAEALGERRLRGGCRSGSGGGIAGGGGAEQVQSWDLLGRPEERGR